MDRDEALRALDEELERGTTLVDQASTLGELEGAQVAVLGRKSRFTAVYRSLGELGDDDRRTVGQRANEVRASLEAAIATRRNGLREDEERTSLERDWLDVTLPGRRPRLGSLNPITIVERQVVDVFTSMGYRVVEGPEVETDWYNFTALNIPPDHPARTEKDTIYLDVPGHPDLLLRTVTSAMQIRTMQ